MVQSVMAVVNVCSELFVSTVSCSCVCCDGFSASNLIAEDSQCLKRGLRVEHFIRPPLSITFEFKWPINLTSILIRPALGPESTLRMSVDASHVHGDACVFNIHRGIVVSDVKALIHLKTRSSSPPATTSLISSKDVSMVTGSQLTPNRLNQYNTIEQPVRHVNILTRLKRLSLTVTRLTGVKPFALDWVEIWGTSSHSCSSIESSEFEAAVEKIPRASHQQDNLFPDHNFHHFSQDGTSLAPTAITSTSHSKETRASFPCPLETQQERAASLIRNKPFKRLRSFPGTSGVGSDSKRTKMEETETAKDSLKPQVNTSHSSTDNSVQQNSSSIELAVPISGSSAGGAPERFLDSLTCEVMVLPMELPSGHLVDRTTLDKLEYNDSLYGRPPTDPFTGLAFTPHSQPQFCPQLKTAIDQFLSSDDSQQPQRRTVGSASQIALHVNNTSKERSVPVQSTSCSLEGPTRQRHNEGTSQCSQQSITLPRKRGHAVRGVIGESFESKVSGSLDDALSNLFS